MSLRVAVPAEAAGGEWRVALVPEVVKHLGRHDVEVCVQQGAGAAAGFADAAYAEAGAQLAGDAAAVLGSADVVLRVSPPAPAEVEQQPEGSALIGFLDAPRRPELVSALRARRITALAMEQVPRSTRAQAMDALSSQRSVAGYRAVLLAAGAYGRFLPMLTTPTGTVRPATLLVIGTGVAGLQAIATARRLGAVVEASDIRTATREQVESLGGRFISTEVEAEAEGGYARELNADERKAQAELLARHVAKANMVITTAEIPGRPAPRTLSAAMVEAMAPGSVIVDLAAASGGNCELSRVGETSEHGGVRIIAPANPAAEMAPQASELYARNLQNLLQLALVEGRFAPDWEDDILAAACLCRDGELAQAGA